MPFRTVSKIPPSTFSSQSYAFPHNRDDPPFPPAALQDICLLPLIFWSSVCFSPLRGPSPSAFRQSLFTLRNDGSHPSVPFSLIRAPFQTQHLFLPNHRTFSPISRGWKGSEHAAVPSHSMSILLPAASSEFPDQEPALSIAGAFPSLADFFKGTGPFIVCPMETPLTILAPPPPQTRSPRFVSTLRIVWYS